MKRSFFKLRSSVLEPLGDPGEPLGRRPAPSATVGVGVGVTLGLMLSFLPGTDPAPDKLFGE